MACEALFVFFLLYYSIEEFIEIKKHRLSYFKSFWNVLDVVVILLGVVCIIFNVYRTIQVNSLLKDLLEKPNDYANFGVLGFWQNQYDNLVAIAVFICWIKVSISRLLTLFSTSCTYALTGASKLGVQGHQPPHFLRKIVFLHFLHLLPEEGATNDHFSFVHI